MESRFKTEKNLRRSPHIHAPILSCRGNVLAIWGPGDCCDAARVAGIGVEMSASRDMPDMHAPSSATRGDTSAIRRPGEGIHAFGMPRIPADLPPIERLPDAHYASIAG